jgi:hypothetical protein
MLGFLEQDGRVATQMVEVTERDKCAIQSNILTQLRALRRFARTQQRDLRLLLEKGLVVASGATNRLEYKLL